MSCPHCGAEHFPEPAGGTKAGGAGEGCPYLGAPFPKLRAGHDELYFGRWRQADASPLDLRRARNRLRTLLGWIGDAVGAEGLPATRKDLARACESLQAAEAQGDGQEAFLHMDHALSYAHRAIGDLLHEKGAAPHSPGDFAAWYEAAEIPFREDW
ncbi:MAG: hypothetical protein AB1346_02860 [Thermodesulfobacteriota bacterium]